MSTLVEKKPSPIRAEKCHIFMTRSKEEFVRAYDEGEYNFLSRVLNEIENQKTRKLSLTKTSHILGCDRSTAKYYMEALNELMLSHR